MAFTVYWRVMRCERNSSAWDFLPIPGRQKNCSTGFRTAFHVVKKRVYLTHLKTGIFARFCYGICFFGDSIYTIGSWRLYVFISGTIRFLPALFILQASLPLIVISMILQQMHFAFFACWMIFYVKWRYLVEPLMLLLSALQKVNFRRRRIKAWTQSFFRWVMISALSKRLQNRVLNSLKSMPINCQMP